MKGACPALAVVLSAAGLGASGAHAQQQKAQGFAVERLYPSAPGGGWMVMDDLDLHGRLGGVVALSGGYARDPLRVSDGARRLRVVSDDASADIGLAVTFDRFRLYLNLDSPIAVQGETGAVGSYSLTAPSVDLGSNPDTISDARIGFDARLLGEPRGPFRLGAGAQLVVPSGSRADYVTDGTYRGMGRVLFAGNLGAFTYAGQLGVHVRPLDDSPAPGSPQGSELLFGVAGGPTVPVGAGGRAAIVIGPEIYGETAFKAFMGSTTTGVEGLLTGRFEQTRDGSAQLRVKLGTGAGLDQHFGAPEWRFVFAVEVLDRLPD